MLSSAAVSGEALWGVAVIRVAFASPIGSESVAKLTVESRVPFAPVRSGWTVSLGARFRAASSISSSSVTVCVVFFSHW
jgi:hypothetical protein